MEEPAEEPAQEPAQEEAPAGETAPAGGADYGFLPSTGLEVGVLAAIGLGLLMLGIALRPGRPVPSGRR